MDALMSLIIGIGLVAAIGLISSILIRSRQKVRDDGASPATSRHPILANPIFWAYVCFVAIAAASTMYFMGVYQ